MRGEFPDWTPLPANFKNNGYLSLGVGKYYHSGGTSGVEGSTTHPRGRGTPPLSDRDMSWSFAGPNGTIQFPDQQPYIDKWGKFQGKNYAPYGNYQYLLPDEEACGKENPLSGDYCHPDFAADGTPPSPPKEGQSALADFITYKDAIVKMQFAADNRAKTGQPFFLVTGIKRPHLNWRAPLSYVDKYPIEKVAAPTQLTLDKSIDPIAYSIFPMKAPNGTNGTDNNFVVDPYHSGTDMQLRLLRQAYYTAVSWADTATGNILDELDSLGLTQDTMVSTSSPVLALCSPSPSVRTRPRCTSVCTLINHCYTVHLRPPLAICPRLSMVHSSPLTVSLIHPPPYLTP
jgi:hypothetical protein